MLKEARRQDTIEAGRCEDDTGSKSHAILVKHDHAWPSCRLQPATHPGSTRCRRCLSRFCLRIQRTSESLLSSHRSNLSRPASRSAARATLQAYPSVWRRTRKGSVRRSLAWTMCRVRRSRMASTELTVRFPFNRRGSHKAAADARCSRSVPSDHARMARSSEGVSASPQDCRAMATASRMRQRGSLASTRRDSSHAVFPSASRRP